MKTYSNADTAAQGERFRQWWCDYTGDPTWRWVNRRWRKQVFTNDVGDLVTFSVRSINPYTFQHSNDQGIHHYVRKDYVGQYAVFWKEKQSIMIVDVVEVRKHPVISAGRSDRSLVDDPGAKDEAAYSVPILSHKCVPVDSYVILG